MTPPSGLEDTPSKGFPFLSCPHCGGALPRLAFPPATVEAQELLPHDERAPELEDATPTAGQPISPRLAPTERHPRQSAKDHP